MSISVIIPVLNEEDLIFQTVQHLKLNGDDLLREIIVVDGGSEDDTVDQARRAGAEVIGNVPIGRACQMNAGANYATGDILYFVHADATPPATCFQDIMEAIEKGFEFGCFSYAFDSDNWLLRINERFTRFESAVVGGGDQTLFIRRDTFKSIGGFDEKYCIMEDFELMRRMRKLYPMKIICKDVIVSARKYRRNSYLRVQFANFIVFTMFRIGMHPEKLKRTYVMLLKG